MGVGGCWDKVSSYILPNYTHLQKRKNPFLGAPVKPKGDEECVDEKVPAVYHLYVSEMSLQKCPDSKRNSDEAGGAP